MTDQIFISLPKKDLENLIIDCVNACLMHTDTANAGRNIGNPLNPQLETDQWFDIQGLCNYLPDKPTRATVYGWVHFSTIPYHKGLKKLRFLKSEIDAWLKTGRRKTRAEIEAEADNFLSNKRK